MKTIEATYVWSATVKVQVSDTATNKEQREALDRVAMCVEPDFKNPILHSCDDNPELID